MIQTPKFTALYSSAGGIGSMDRKTVTFSNTDKELENLKIENKTLNQRIQEQQQFIDKLSSNGYYNSDIIRENQELRERLSYFQTEYEKVKKENLDLDTLNRELKNQANNQTRPQSTYSSTETFELRKRIEQLEKDNLEKQQTINNLQLNRPYQPSSQFPFKSDLHQVNSILDRCQVIANRMLDTICDALPEWKAATADLREIRSDIVCSLENIETILKESITQNNRPGMTGEINQFILDERNRLKQEQQSAGVKEDLINQIYSVVMSYSSYSTTEEKLRTILNSLNQLLAQLHLNSFRDVVNEISNLQSEKISLEQTLQDYKKAGPPQFNLLHNPQVDFTLFDVLLAMHFSFDQLIDLINNSMNRASVVGGFSLEQEKDNYTYSEEELRRMDLDVFVQCTRHKKDIFDLRIRDMLQISEMLIDIILRERDQLDKQMRQASSVIDGFQKQGVSTKPDLFAQREHETISNQLIEDCYKFICLDSDLNRVDRYNIRTTSAEALASRIRSFLPSTGSFNSSLWSSNDTLLLLNRMVKNEYELNQLQNKHSLFIEEMMKVENQRDSAIKQQQKAQNDLHMCEVQLSQVKMELQKKEGEVTEWKTLASSQKPVSYTPAVDYQPVNTNVNWCNDKEIPEIIARVKAKIMSI